MTFKNEAALKTALVAACTNAVAEVEEKIYRTIDGNLNQFYGEFSPKLYIRTDALSNSLARTGVKPFGNGASAEVYFNTPSYSTGSWSGETVLNVAMESSVPHGGYAGGTPVWSTSMAELGNINDLLIGALRAQGIPI